MRAQAYLLDSSIYIFRAWFSMPDQWRSPQGYSLNAVYGYTRFLLDFLHAENPHTIAAGFDESLGSCFRNDIFPTYKASRELPDEALAFQLNACREVTERLGIPSFSCARYEADDYLATLARLFREQDMDITVVTRDKDLGQILHGAGDRWWDYAASIRLDAQSFFDRFAVTPQQFADYQALVGDSVDDIPGVPGIGAKTAARLLQEFGDLNGLERGLDRLSSLNLRGATRIRDNLVEHWPQLLIYRRLTELDQYIPGVTAAPAYQPKPANIESLIDYLTALNLEGPLIRRCRQLQSVTVS